MKALEQFFHFCIACWTIAGVGAINSALNFPPDEHRGIVYFIFFIFLGVLGKNISEVIYYGNRSYLSIALSIFFYFSIITGLLYIKKYFLVYLFLFCQLWLSTSCYLKTYLNGKIFFHFDFILDCILKLKKVLKK